MASSQSTPIHACTDRTRYRVSETARDDVPYFGPTPPAPSIFRKGQDFRNFDLTKPIKAENAAYKAEKFDNLAERTRISLLDGLSRNLEERAPFYGMTFLESTDATTASNASTYRASLGLFSSVKKAQTINRKDVVAHGHNQVGSRLSMATVSDRMSSPSSARSSIANGRSSPFQNQMGSVSTPNNAGNSMANERSSSSRGSGMRTPKEIERKQRPFPPYGGGPEALSDLAHVFDRLKTEKEDLLMQNVVCKTDIKKLKQRQSMLSLELERAQDVIQRLRRMLKRSSNGSDLSTSHYSAGSDVMRPDRAPLWYRIFST